MTKVGSVWVTGLAALMAISLGFLGFVQAIIASIPWAVIGGITLVLYGLIASNGVKVLIKDRTDLSETRNLIIISSMLVIGIGGAVLNVGELVSLSGMSLAAMVGIALNLIIPREKELEETISDSETFYKILEKEKELLYDGTDFLEEKFPGVKLMPETQEGRDQHGFVIDNGTLKFIKEENQVEAGTFIDEEYLSQLSTKEVRAIASDLKIKNYSKFSKMKLIKEIIFEFVKRQV